MVQFLAKVRDLSLFQSIQTGSGAHPATYLVLTEGGGGISLGLKQLEYDDHFQLVSCFRKYGAVPPLSPGFP
jgi:hypothetical protein